MLNVPSDTLLTVVAEVSKNLNPFLSNGSILPGLLVLDKLGKNRDNVSDSDFSLILKMVRNS
jgi:hypothetical protein